MLLIYKAKVKKNTNPDHHHKFLNALTNSDRDYLFTHNIDKEQSIYFISTTKNLLTENSLKIIKNGSLWVQQRIDTNAFSLSEQFDFNITLNAIKRQVTGEAPIPEDSLVDWFKEKTISNGFEPLSVRASSIGKMVINKGNVRGKFGARPVTFSGRLKIIDIALFKNAIENGFIGARTKHQGFGMLEIK